MTNLGDSHRDGHRAGVKTKAVTIIGDFHQDGHRAGAKTKAMTNISNSRHGKNKNKAGTNLGDSHQDGHRAGRGEYLAKILAKTCSPFLGFLVQMSQEI